MKLRIIPYKFGSTSVRKLSQSLNDNGINTIRVRRDRTGYSPPPRRILLNWGCIDIPAWSFAGNHTWINSPPKVYQASNKLLTLQKLSADSVVVPQFTVDRTEAEQWIADGNQVVCRRLLSASAGRGITIASTLEELCDAPLYTKYVKKIAEYRVHVFNGKVIDVQQKKKRAGDGVICTKVRNSANGWVFCRGGVLAPEQVLEQGLNAVISLGLDFGAVDVVWNNKQQVAYVLEVNTAPGIEGATVLKYTQTIKEFLNVD